MNKFEGGLPAALHFTPLPIPPESGCAEFTAYAKERKPLNMYKVHRLNSSKQSTGNFHFLVFVPVKPSLGYSFCAVTANLLESAISGLVCSRQVARQCTCATPRD